MFPQINAGLFVRLVVVFSLAFSFGEAPVRAGREAAGVRYAAAGGLVDGACDTWADACELQTALSVAAAGEEVWVKEGVYHPSSSLDRAATFQLKSSVALYGGFDGTETARAERDWAVHLTILSGDIDHNDANHDGNFISEVTSDTVGANSIHVVTTSGVESSAVLDGFTITAGQADGDYNAGDGGGLFNTFGSPTLAQVRFSGNFAIHNGGGMANEACTSLTLTGVSFTGNYAGFDGGGMYSSTCQSMQVTDAAFENNTAVNDGGGMKNYASAPLITRAVFRANAASYGGGLMNGFNELGSPTLLNVAFLGNQARQGGGMFQYFYSSPKLTNVLFSGNLATEDGGAIRNWNHSSPILTNVTLAGNRAGLEGSAIYNGDGSSPLLQNVLAWDNLSDSAGGTIFNYAGYDPNAPVFRFSLVESCNPSGTWNSACGADGGGNLADADPLFVDPELPAAAPTLAGDYRLQPGSPAIDTGNNTSIAVTTDLAGGPRFVEIPGAPNRGLGTAPLVDLGAYEANFSDAQILKSVSPVGALPGQAITYTLSFSNSGSLPATGVVISDVIPAFVTIQSVAFNGAAITETTAGPGYAWAVQDLAAGQAGTILLRSTLAEPLAAGIYTNTARIAAAGDAGADNNRSDVGLQVFNAVPLAAGEAYATLEDTSLFVAAPGLLANDFDANGDPLVAFKDSNPALGQLTLHPDGSFVYTPTLNTSGLYRFRYHASDGGLNSNIVTVTLSISAVNDAPEANGEHYGINQATALAAPAPGLLANDGDIDGDPLTATLDSGPAHGLLALQADGSFVYTPTIEYYGSDSFAYHASDGEMDSQVVTATIEVNARPLVDGGPDQTALEGQALNFKGGFDDPLQPPGLTAEEILWNWGDGSTVQGTLNPSHTYLDDGVYTVTLTVTDSLGAAGTDSLLVTVENLAPELPLLPDLQTMPGQAVTLTVVFSDPGLLDTHQVVIEWQPGVTQTLNLAAGELMFTVDRVFPQEGRFPVTVTVSDPDGGSASRSFEVAVKVYRIFTPLALQSGR